ASRNRGKAIVNSTPPTYDQEPKMVVEDDALSKEKEIDKLMALISLSFKKIYKPTNNNLRTSLNTSTTNQDNTLRINRGTEYDNQRVVNVDGARENVGTQVELKAHYMYMPYIQEVTPDVAENSRSIFDAESLQKVQNDDDNYNVFVNDREHLEQPEYVNDTYPDEQGDTNITTDSLDMSNNRGKVDQDEDEDLARERDLLASLIEKLKCEIDESKDHNKLLESSNKNLVYKLKSEIEDFKNKKKCLESSKNHFKEANTKLAKNNQLMFKDLKKFQAELDRYYDVNCASKMENDYAKAKGDLMSYKMESQKSFNECCYNDNLSLMLAPESDEKIPLAQESRSKLSDLIKPFDYKNLNNLYDLFVPQRKKSPEQRYFSESADLEKFHLCLKEEMVAELRYFNSLKHEIDSLKSQLETQKTQFFNEIDRLSKEYYYADNMNAILGVYTRLDEVTNFQCDYLEALEKCQCLENELSKRNTKSKSFEALQQHAINLEHALQQCQEQVKNDKAWKEKESNSF
ncbi:hypothetical protein Tco_0714393, partial [Tanacetum coccineum]